MNFKICFQFMWIFLLEFWWELHQICRLLLEGWSYYFLGSADIKKLSWRPARQFHHYWLTFMVKEGATPRRKVILSPGHEPCSYEPVTPLLCILTPFCCCYGLVFFFPDIFGGEGGFLCMRQRKDEVGWIGRWGGYRRNWWRKNRIKIYWMKRF